MILISPSGDRSEKLGAFSKYVPLSVPYGIGALAGYLSFKRKKAEVIDEEIEWVSVELLHRKLKRIDPPYIFGISCLTAGIGRGIQIAEMIRNDPRLKDAFIIFGGIHPTVLPEEVLTDGYADIVVRDEGEITMDLLYDKIKCSEDFSGLKGISYMGSKGPVHNPSRRSVDLNTLPLFPYDLFYQYSSRYSLGFITSSRGCPYHCIFCSQRSISGSYYRFRDPEIVMEEIDYLSRIRGIRYITFQDDNFLPNKARTIRLCEMLIEKYGGSLHLDCQARGDNIDGEVLGVMKRAGFRIIHVGIECAKDRLLNLLEKGEKLHQIIDGVRLIKKYGIKVSGTFILGLPTETKDDRRAAYELAKDLDLDYVRFNNATPYPGTKLYEMAQTSGRFQPGENWKNLNACGSLAENPFRRNAISYVPEGTGEADLRNDVIKYNLLFSLHPKRVLALLLSRVGPAGWFELPEKWYLKPYELFQLMKFSTKVATNFTLLIVSIVLHKFK